MLGFLRLRLNIATACRFAGFGVAFWFWGVLQIAGFRISGLGVEARRCCLHFCYVAWSLGGLLVVSVVSLRLFGT